MSQRINYIHALPNCDLNNVIIPGEYELRSSSTYTNAPLTGAYTGFIMVESRSQNTSMGKQTIEYRISSTTRVFVRVYSNSNGGNMLGGTFAFGPWEELITPNNDYTTSKNITTTGTIKAGRLESTGVITTTGTSSAGRLESTGVVAASTYVSTGAFSVASLPSNPPAGSWAFATNGRKAGEGAGAGTGCPVYFQGTWKTFYDNTTVLA